MAISREEALGLFRKYNRTESLYHHALSVEAVMREAARREGEDEEYWGIVGLLHDIDWEMFPDEHCRKAPELLKEIDAPDDMIHAICSHGYGLVSDIKPERRMEKMLYAVDELAGLVTEKSFAAGVNRTVIANGAEMLGMDVSDLIQLTIDGMTGIAPEIGLWPEA